MKIIFSPTAILRLHKIQDKDRKKIVEKVKQLSLPFPRFLDIKKLKDEDFKFRLRVGGFRIFFDFSTEDFRIHDIRRRNEKTYK